ncbi:MAG TPA: DUF4112 domain-containing protein [Vicinamibacterales bacterium]|nr:DUF4112 domain-containing protein [Vicinamibacterales bacterium]
MNGSEERALVALRKWAVLLDSAFQVPGTRLRFGLDPVVGLIPGAGDLVTGFFSTMIVLHAVRLRVPKVVIARMMLNVAIDMLVGAVPLLGDLFDAGFKANLRNLAMLERHAVPGVPPTRSDYLFVGLCVAVIVLLAALPLVLLWWLLSWLVR